MPHTQPAYTANKTQVLGTTRRVLRKKKQGLSRVQVPPTAGPTRPLPRRPGAHAWHAHPPRTRTPPSQPRTRAPAAHAHSSPLAPSPRGPGAPVAHTRTPRRRPHEGAVARGLDAGEVASPGPAGRRSPPAPRPFSLGCRRRQGFRRGRRAPPHHRSRRTPEPRGTRRPSLPPLGLTRSSLAAWTRSQGWSPRRAGGREEAGKHMRRGRLRGGRRAGLGP